MKQLFLMSILGLCSQITVAQCAVDFSITPQTGYGIQCSVTGANTTGAYSTVWNWGDGTTETISIASTLSTHTYANPGTYQICMNYIDAFGCLVENQCKSVTLSTITNLCGLSVQHTLVGNTLTVTATGSGASDPGFAFVPDVLYQFNNPFDFSRIQTASGNTATFQYTYAPNGNQSFYWAVGYGDGNEENPSCEENGYEGVVSFGSPVVSVEEHTRPDLQIVPTINSGQFELKTSKPIQDGTIYNAQGQVVHQFQGNYVEASHLTNGWYYITSKDLGTTASFIIQR